MKLDFVCIGFDFRTPKIPPNGFTADATAWPRKDELYEEKIAQPGLKENSLQLIQPDSDKHMNELIFSAKNLKDSLLIGIEIPKVVFYSCCKLWPDVVPTCLDEKEWGAKSLDVCDLNGFFSIFHMEVLDRTAPDINNNQGIGDAFVFAQIANILVPDHSPFITVRLNVLAKSST